MLGPQDGWRAAFALGGLLAVAIVLVRRHVPESPRWLVTHGRVEEARRIVMTIEAEVEAEHGPLPAAPRGLRLSRHRPPTASWREIAHVLVRRYPVRSGVALAMMIAQAFFYNAIFFTYALVLTRFHQVPEERVALYIFPFALGNVMGPLLLGPLFDRIGRRRMIGLTYTLSGATLMVVGLAFMAGWLDAMTQALGWSIVFFLASAAASSAYLTVSEVFPLEMRGMAIALFYAVGTGAGGFVAPVLFGALVETGSRGAVTAGYAVGAALMLAAGVLAWRHAVDAERKPLEEIARPLSAHED